MHVMAASSAINVEDLQFPDTQSLRNASPELLELKGLDHSPVAEMPEVKLGETHYP
jgi:hypothetical protein